MGAIINILKKKKVIFFVALFLVIAIGGVTYSIFNYTKTGETNELLLGDIYLHYDTSKSLSLEEFEPRNSLDANTYIGFSIEGINENINNILYDIILVNGNVPTGKTEDNRIDPSFLRFTLVKTVGAVDTTIFSNESYTGINNRTIYSDNIPANTTSELTHSYKLYVWVSDTISVGMGNDVDYTISEWNDLFASLRVKVNGYFAGSSPTPIPVTYYTVNFNANGGVASFASKQVEEDNPVGALPILQERAGYIFDGWYTDDTWTTPVDPVNTIIDSSMVTNGEVTFIAKWSEDLRVAQIGTTKYDTLADAISQGVPTTGVKTTITILRDITLSSTITIPSTKNIELDIGSYTISGSANNLFSNSGTINVISGTINNTGAKYAVDNKSTGVLNISGGLIKSTGSTNAIVNVGQINMTGGKITCSAQGAAINNNSGGRMTMSAGEIIGTNTTKGQAIYNDGGTLTVSGTAYIEANSATRPALHNNSGTVTVSGGTILAKNANCERGAIQNSATMTITGGTITSKSTYSGTNTGYGPSGVQNSGTLTIGTQDNAYSTSSIVIIAEKDGINSTTNFNLYDGMIKGRASAVKNENKINGTESGSTKQNDTEEISGVTYYRLYYTIS